MAKSSWKREEFVWNKVWSTRNKWSDQEVFDSYKYYKKYALERGGQPEFTDEMIEFIKKNK